MSDARKIQLGVCAIEYKGRDLGHTIGGVTVTYTPEFHETKADRTGNSVVEKFLVGERLSVEASLAEFTLDNLKTAINQHSENGDDAISIGSIAGKRVSDTAGLLKLHPIANATDNRNDDIALYKAVVTNELKIEHKNDGEKVLPVVFDALVDENRADGNLLGFIGDSLD